MARYNTAGRPSGSTGNQPIPGAAAGYAPPQVNNPAPPPPPSANPNGVPLYAGTNNLDQSGMYNEVNRVTGNADNRVKRLQDIGYRDASSLGQQGAVDKTMGLGYANQAAQDYATQGQDRGSTLGALDRLRSFYQQGPGPSAAQAQLRQGEDQSLANSMALASSGRGAGDNAVAARNALFTNAATQQATNAQAATLRAQEAQNWRGQQLQGMGLEQNTLGNLRGQDLTAMGQANQTGLGYGQLGQGYDTTAAQTEHAYEENAAQAGLTGDQLRNQIFTTQGQLDLGRYQADQSYNSAAMGGAAAMRGQNLALLNAGITAAGTIGGAVIGGPAGAVVGGAGANAAANGIESSDVRNKRDIAPASFEDYIRQLDQSNDRAGKDVVPKFDLRPAQGYGYNYKDPNAQGATPGRAFGPMAQDLEKTPAGASTVFDGPRGKMVDTSRLSLVNAAGLSEQQRKLDDMQERINQLVVEGGPARWTKGDDAIRAQRLRELANAHEEGTMLGMPRAGY